MTAGYIKLKIIKNGRLDKIRLSKVFQNNIRLEVKY